MPPPFPQAHRAKNLASSGGKGTKTGDMVLHIQKALPNARVMYVSATAAADVSDLGYMVRLGLWGRGTAFPSYHPQSDLGYMARLTTR